MEGARSGSGDGLARLTTQTPATPYLPSAAFRSMTLALFWDRSGLAFLAAGSAIAEDAVGSDTLTRTGDVADVNEFAEPQAGQCSHTEKF